MSDPFTSREICKICYHVNPVGFSVPDGIWQAVVPEGFRDKVVCFTCFARLGDERCVEWDREIELFPVSMATHLGKVNSPLPGGQSDLGDRP